MAKTTSNKISVKASAAKSFGSSPPRGKTLWLDPDICFYNIEDVDDNIEG